jgi:hypothetical protein
VQRLRGSIVPDPLTEEPELLLGIVPIGSLKTLVEQLRRDLRRPWVESYWHEHRIEVGLGRPTGDDG